MPVDRTNRHSQLDGQRSLVYIRILLNFFQQGQIADRILGQFDRRFNIQWLNYNPDKGLVKSAVYPAVVAYYNLPRWK